MLSTGEQRKKQINIKKRAIRPDGIGIARSPVAVCQSPAMRCDGQSIGRAGRIFPKAAVWQWPGSFFHSEAIFNRHVIDRHLIMRRKEYTQGLPHSKWLLANKE
ncbi:hypothetical protein CDAR_74871 [Caerostris darwini]|uniref:Uncharacterized protein n=1 Tax=Caerostris darwini TaxID=1538125 RepID=A0AAV4P0H4_9ARAC|nr:hypothetical protein CDAR_74871 [Caerostris darwini]